MLPGDHRHHLLTLMRRRPVGSMIAVVALPAVAGVAIGLRARSTHPPDLGGFYRAPSPLPAGGPCSDAPAGSRG